MKKKRSKTNLELFHGLQILGKDTTISQQIEFTATLMDGWAERGQGREMCEAKHTEAAGSRPRWLHGSVGAAIEVIAHKLPQLESACL